MTNKHHLVKTCSSSACPNNSSLLLSSLGHWTPSWGEPQGGLPLYTSRALWDRPKSHACSRPLLWSWGLLNPEHQKQSLPSLGSSMFSELLGLHKAVPFVQRVWGVSLVYLHSLVALRIIERGLPYCKPQLADQVLLQGCICFERYRKQGSNFIPTSRFQISIIMWLMQQPHRQPIYSFCTLARFYILNGQKEQGFGVSERGFCQLALAWFVSEALSVSILWMEEILHQLIL